jgi:uncharacterized protein (TIGR03083 family)
MSETGTLRTARAALSVVSARTAGLVALAPDTAIAIPGSSWRVREAAVHLAVVGFRYAGMVHGERIQFASLTPDECARRNDELNADIPESRPIPLAALVREGAAGLLTATASCTDARMVLFDGGVTLRIGQLVGIAVAEHLLHGYDMAVAVGQPWPIDPEHAAAGLIGYHARNVCCLNPATAGHHTADYRIELTTGPCYTVHLVDGELRAEPTGSAPVDCTITADPVALLLIGSGRLSWSAGIALGLLHASGDRRELALGFDDLFRCP